MNIQINKQKALKAQDIQTYYRMLEQVDVEYFEPSLKKVMSKIEKKQK